MTDTPLDGLFADDEHEPEGGGFAAWLAALEQATTEDDLFSVLASKRPPRSKLARQKLRGQLVTLLKRRFQELESDAAAARTADAWLQEGGELDTLQGQGFVAETTSPWGEAVSGAAVLDEVRETYDAYVYAPDVALDALSLWVAYSHVFDLFGVSPILDLSSPTKRCGKSTAIVVSRHLCPSPLLSGNITPAALFRAVEAWRPTLLIDEADTFAKMHDELRGILNAGHTRDTAFVIRAEGDSNEPRMFSTWAPKMVGAIGRLPDTIEDRSVRVVLTRKPTGISRRDAFDQEGVRRDCEPVRRRLVRFTLDELDAIATAEVERPTGLNDRAWNNWRPLFAVAAVAGADWTARAIRAALVLSGDANAEMEEDNSTLALQHVWEVLEPAGRLATVTVLQHLVSKDEGPWAKWWEAPVAKEELRAPASGLARLLRPFGIKPRQLWVGEKNVRGYAAEDFLADDVRAFLPEKAARDASNARTESPSHTGSSVPSVPSVVSGVPSVHVPVPGDPGYAMWIDRKHVDGHITDRELRSLQNVSTLIARRREHAA